MLQKTDKYLELHGISHALSRVNSPYMSCSMTLMIHNVALAHPEGWRDDCQLKGPTSALHEVGVPTGKNPMYVKLFPYKVFSGVS